MPQEAIQALDVSLNHSISLNPQCQSVARAFFFEGGLKQNLGFGAEVSQFLPSDPAYLAISQSAEHQCRGLSCTQEPA